MKKILFVLCAILLVTLTGAQTINIPDVNFKSFLINGGAKDANGNAIEIDVNKDGEIQVSETVQVKQIISSSNYDIISFEGINNFKELEKISITFSYINRIDVQGLAKLKTLILNSGRLTSLDVKNMSSLEYLDCSYQDILNLDLSDLVNLKVLRVNANMNLTEIDVQNCLKLEEFNASACKLSNIDLSKNILLKMIDLDYNQLINLNVKNGSHQQINLKGNPTLKSICCDESEKSNLENIILINNYTNCTINTNCEFLDTSESIYGEKISISPNPAKNIIKFKSPDKVTKIEIFDISGRLIKTELSIKNNEANINYLKSGNYIFKIYNKQKVTTQKVIKE
ncbi:T9SS type A sorting domain-containing protein [Chryseobacterium sp. FH1]|uniref:T9SS type A sorting domain-containing protein n=1 Tax=Chryseobacterium sp. FH1 TaxID=1233951 RepID=UPI0004E3EE56|nr:T9SS type A sorting domain-containing protein [Chryseobacterium sp. FH1]KFC24291.1 hypothetical protein IO90_03040 [Chryseobacterium sp. FH1]